MKHHAPGHHGTNTIASLVEDGVLFRPGPSEVKLRTARQMQLEVARRRGRGAIVEHGNSGWIGEEGFNVGRERGAQVSTGSRSLTVRRLSSSCQVGTSGDSTVGGGGGVGVVLEVNRTGGGGRKGSGGAGRARTGEGRPNMIFTPSLVPVGMDSVRSSPITLGNCVGEGRGRTSGVRWGTVEESNDGTTAAAAAAGGWRESTGGIETQGSVCEEGSRDARTV